MLFVAFILLGMSAAARVCWEAPPSELEYIMGCTDYCLLGDTAHLEGICANNLKGFCQLDGGVASYFRRFGGCLETYCTLDVERISFANEFAIACGWRSLNKTQAQWVGDWKQYYLVAPAVTMGGAQSTVAPTATSFITKTTTSTMSAPTITRTGGAVAVSSAVSATPISTWSSSVVTASTWSSSVFTATTSNASTVLDDEVPPTTRTSTSASSRSSASSVPVSEQVKQPVLSTAAIAGVAVGGAALVALTVVAAFFLLRRRKRIQSGEPRSMSPPTYESANGKVAHEKAELDGLALGQQYSEVGVGAPVGYVELDAGCSVSPVMEPVHLSASERKARVAQNF